MTEAERTAGDSALVIEIPDTLVVEKVVPTVGVTWDLCGLR